MSRTKIEKFIERGTDYPLQNGKLSIYETNCACKDIKFYFERHVLTLMLSGHKTIESKNLKFEFFPGTFFIPEKESVNHVSIPNASIDNPTKCLVLQLDPDYLQRIYDEILYSENSSALIHDSTSETKTTYFFSSDQHLIQAFVRLYQNQLHSPIPSKSLIDELIIKEILYRVFNTPAVNLLTEDFANSVSDHTIAGAISYIKGNIDKKITVQKLANISRMGQTTFYKRFKNSTGSSPVDYILHERIKQAKIMIQKDAFSLQEIAYKCGFNSYEYFCNTFKKIEQIKPTEFKYKRHATPN